MVLPYRFLGLLGRDIEGGDIISEAATEPGLEMSPPSLSCAGVRGVRTLILLGSS